MTFSFVGGLQLDVQVQKATKIGRVVIRPRKIPVFTPPPKENVRKAGAPTRAPISRLLEKLSFPGPSAGRAGLFMAAD